MSEPRRSRSPEECSRGTRPRYAITCRGESTRRQGTRLRGEHQRRVQVDAADALEALDGASERRGQRQLGDLAIEGLAPRELVLEQAGVLAKHRPILGRERHGRRACGALC